MSIEQLQTEVLYLDAKKRADIAREILAGLLNNEQTDGYSRDE